MQLLISLTLLVLVEVRDPQLMSFAYLPSPLTFLILREASPAPFS
jgi:hypothetical protein